METVRKIFSLFSRMKNLREFYYWDTILWVYQILGLKCSHFNGPTCAPCEQKSGDSTPYHSVTRLGFGNIALPWDFYGVERSTLLVWSIYDHGLCRLNLDHIFVVVFTRSRSFRLSCIWICVPAVPWLAPKTYKAAILSSLEVNFAHSNLEA